MNRSALVTIGVALLALWIIGWMLKIVGAAIHGVAVLGVVVLLAGFLADRLGIGR